jgi:hypothetical protein
MFSTNVSQLFGGESCYTAPDFATLGASAGDPLTLMISYQVSQNIKRERSALNDYMLS